MTARLGLAVKYADLCAAALAADKAVLLQKPMATTLADCDRIIVAAERRGHRSGKRAARQGE
jgi:hypothetical protein